MADGSLLKDGETELEHVTALYDKAERGRIELYLEIAELEPYKDWWLALFGVGQRKKWDETFDVDREPNLRLVIWPKPGDRMSDTDYFTYECLANALRAEKDPKS